MRGLTNVPAHPHPFPECHRWPGNELKACFATRDEARKAIRLHSGVRERLHAYACRCGGFHLGHRPKNVPDWIPPGHTDG